MKDDNKKNETISSAHVATSSAPPPPPLLVPGLSLTKMALINAKNNARAAGVPVDISERELYEANERINAVEAAKKNQGEKENSRRPKDQDLIKVKSKIKDMEINVNAIKIKLEDMEKTLERKIKKMAELNNALKERLSSALIGTFESLKKVTSDLESENSKLAKLNNKREILEAELKEIVRMIDTSAQALRESKGKLMPSDLEKANLFKAIKASEKENGGNNPSEDADAKKTKEFKSFLDIVSEKITIKDEIKKIEESKCNDKVIKLDELRKKLRNKELDYQYALRSERSAMIYEIENKKESTRPNSFFQNSNVDTLGSEEADRKSATQTFSSLS